MKLGTRLLLPLLPATTLVMVLYGTWALRERENRLTPQVQEVQAYATALGLALDQALRDAQRADVQQLLTEVTRAPGVYAILVYDSAGVNTLVSDPASTPEPAPARMLDSVLATGGTVTFERQIDDQLVYSVLRALRGPGGRVTGALEVAQPLESIALVQAQVRRRFVLNTLTLLAALTIITLWLVRRVVARPMEQLVGAARALGEGQLGHRIPEAGGGELADLARELNRMAERLGPGRGRARGRGTARPRATAAGGREAGGHRESRGRSRPRDRGPAQRDLGSGRADAPPRARPAGAAEEPRHHRPADPAHHHDRPQPARLRQTARAAAPAHQARRRRNRGARAAGRRADPRGR